MSDWLMHHGVKGMKWGVRRYQPYGEGGYNPQGNKRRGYIGPVHGIVPTSRKPKGILSENPVSRSSRAPKGISENPMSRVPRFSAKKEERPKSKKEFKKAFRKEWNDVFDSDKDYSAMLKRVNAYDAKRLKEHPGYESGDDYDENWRNLKGKDKATRALRQYSQDVENWETYENAAHKRATQYMLDKYGSANWKEAYKLTKKRG